MSRCGRRSYCNLVGPLVQNWSAIESTILAPLGIPRNPITMSRFGLHAIQPAARLARNKFKPRQHERCLRVWQATRSFR